MFHSVRYSGGCFLVLVSWAVGSGVWGGGGSRRDGDRHVNQPGQSTSCKIRL